jgi:NitT/TauT family transport system permease protein
MIKDGNSGMLSVLPRVLANPVGLMTGRVLVVLILLVIWELTSGALLPKFWVSSPSSIFKVLISWIVKGSLWSHLYATLLAMTLGYGLGAIIGIAAGLFLGLSRQVERVLAPFITALYALPKIALAPLFVIFLGIEIESKVALVAIIVFFLLLYNTLDGVHDVDQDLVHVLSIMGAKRSEVVSKVLIPAALPWIFTGLRIAVRYALTAAILGELIASNKGIGFLIEYSAGQYDSTSVYAAVLILVVCSVILTEVLTRTESSALRWRI